MLSFEHVGLAQESLDHHTREDAPLTIFAFQGHALDHPPRPASGDHRAARSAAPTPPDRGAVEL
jgi:hypothetical protein